MNEIVMQDWLEQRAARSPERAALIYGDTQWTFRQLDDLVDGAAHGLLRLGIGKGARVAVLMGNSDMYVLQVHAIPRIGAVLVPLNTRLAANELAWQVSRLSVRFLITDEVNFERARDISKIATQIHVVDVRTLDAKRETSAIDSHLIIDAPHSIIFTSGTTGKPKGAVLTYGNHWWNAIASALNLGLREDDVWLACLPLYHVGGLAIVLRSVIYGSPIVVHPAFDAEDVNNAFDEQRVTIVSLVSTMLQQVIELRRPRPFPSTLRCILLGGGPAPKDLLEQCAELNVPIVQTYGLTEAASQVATLAPERGAEQAGFGRQTTNGN